MAWATATKLPKHDHDLGPMNAWKSDTCERCKLNREKTGVEIHTCKSQGAFGRRDANCTRCNQLTAGINVETSLGSNLKRAAQHEDMRMRDLRDHKCSERCGVICTFGEW